MYDPILFWKPNDLRPLRQCESRNNFNTNLHIFVFFLDFIRLQYDIKITVGNLLNIFS